MEVKPQKNLRYGERILCINLYEFGKWAIEVDPIIEDRQEFQKISIFSAHLCAPRSIKDPRRIERENIEDLLKTANVQFEIYTDMNAVHNIKSNFALSVVPS